VHLVGFYYKNSLASVKESCCAHWCLYLYVYRICVAHYATEQSGMWQYGITLGFRTYRALLPCITCTCTVHCCFSFTL